MTDRSPLCTPVESDLVRLDGAHGRVVACTVSHADEADNQDAAALLSLPRGVALLVADGVGGSPRGRDAARAARDAVTETFAKAFASGAADTPSREAALDGFERANRAVLALGAGAATTLALLLIEDGVARSVHAGDSAILVTGQRGRLRHWTVSHSPVGYAVEAGMLREDEALVHEDRNLVLNLLGSREMRIELGPPVKLHTHDTCLVASDGVFDNLSTEEIVETIRKGDLSRAAVTLRDRALARMHAADETGPSKPDDLTFLLYRGTPHSP